MATTNQSTFLNKAKGTISCVQRKSIVRMDTYPKEFSMKIRESSFFDLFYLTNFCNLFLQKINSAMQPYSQIVHFLKQWLKHAQEGELTIIVHCLQLRKDPLFSLSCKFHHFLNSKILMSQLRNLFQKTFLTFCFGCFLA